MSVKTKNNFLMLALILIVIVISGTAIYLVNKSEGSKENSNKNLVEKNIDKNEETKISSNSKENEGITTTSNGVEIEETEKFPQSLLENDFLIKENQKLMTEFFESSYSDKGKKFNGRIDTTFLEKYLGIDKNEKSSDESKEIPKIDIKVEKFKTTRIFTEENNDYLVEFTYDMKFNQSSGSYISLAKYEYKDNKLTLIGLETEDDLDEPNPFSEIKGLKPSVIIE